MAQIKSVKFNEGGVIGGKTTTCTVELDSAVSETVSITLKCEGPVSCQETVDIQAGKDSVPFEVRAEGVETDETACVTAQLKDTLAMDSDPLNVRAAALDKITFVPSTVTAGEQSRCTITLDGSAPKAGGFRVALSSQGLVRNVPRDLIILGSKGAFTVETTEAWRGEVDSTDTPAPLTGAITANLSGATRTGTLTLNPLRCQLSELPKQAKRLLATLALLVSLAFFASLVATMLNADRMVGRFHFTGDSPYLFLPYRSGFFLAGFALVVFWYAVLGWIANRKMWGVLIDEQNRVSLSQFQAALWTALVLSAYGVAALSNIFIPWQSVPDESRLKQLQANHAKERPGAREAAGGTDRDATKYHILLSGFDTQSASGLAVGIPIELYIIMGISATTLVTAGIITQGRKDKQPAELPERQQTAEAANLLVENVTAAGDVAVNRTVCQASWTDLFQGTTPDDFEHVDLSRLQALFFTVVLVLGYATAVCHLFGSHLGPITEFPKLDTGVLFILGISHTAYLAYKSTGGNSNAR